jgi:hypothetical protein
VADCAIFLTTLYGIIFRWWSYFHNGDQNLCIEHCNGWICNPRPFIVMVGCYLKLCKLPGMNDHTMVNNVHIQSSDLYDMFDKCLMQVSLVFSWFAFWCLIKLQLLLSSLLLSK